MKIKNKNKGRLGLPSSVVDATFEAKKKNIKMKRTPQVMMNILEAMILGHGRISRAWYYIYRPYFAFLFKNKIK